MCIDHICKMNDLCLDGSAVAHAVEGAGAVGILMMKKNDIAVIGPEGQELCVDLSDGAVPDQEILLTVTLPVVIFLVFDLFLVEFGKRIVMKNGVCSNVNQLIVRETGRFSCKNGNGGYTLGMPRRYPQILAFGSVQTHGKGV